MAHCDNRYIKQSLELARSLTILADEGETSSTDDGCSVLYGVIRDCAYRIRAQAEREKTLHKRLGLWENGDAEAENGRRTEAGGESTVGTG